MNGESSRRTWTLCRCSKRQEAILVLAVVSLVVEKTVVVGELAKEAAGDPGNKVAPIFRSRASVASRTEACANIGGGRFAIGFSLSDSGE